MSTAFSEESPFIFSGGGTSRGRVQKISKLLPDGKTTQ